jgi:hypothetical protein
MDNAHTPQYLAQHYPRYFLRIVNRHEEAFALVLLLLERHHLWKHGACGHGHPRVAPRLEHLGCQN